jgi:glutamate carboxypeptidase
MRAALYRFAMIGRERYYNLHTMAHGTLTEALAVLGARQHDMPRMTRDWVEINSYTENVAGVNHVGELLRGAFALPSLRLEIKASARFGDHLIWRTAAADELDAAPILLIGHHDTVFPPGHFEGWREEDGRATGPGALDMKGGLALVRAVLAALEEVGALKRLPVVMVSVSDEEVGSPDSQAHLTTAARQAQCALVFESGRAGDAIVTRRRGTGAVTCTATGKAAHAGNAHRDGANAIWALSRFVDQAQALTDYARGRTVNVGLIKGGTSKNTVPAEASCMIDLRFESESDARALVAELAAAAKSAELPGTHLALEGGIRRLPLERTPASAALYAEYAACQREAGLGDREADLVGGGSDANTVAPLGVPAIDGLGPRGAGFHTTGEYVELGSFLPKAEALLRFLWGRLPRP